MVRQCGRNKKGVHVELELPLHFVPPSALTLHTAVVELGLLNGCSAEVRYVSLLVALAVILMWYASRPRHVRQPSRAMNEETVRRGREVAAVG